MILIFLGPPYAGKGTQTKILEKKLNIPVFSMGALIREAREKGDSVIEEAYKNYSLKGLNLPTEIKFGLLKGKMEEANGNFILDNFPATKEDLKFFLNFVNEEKLLIDKVIYLTIDTEEMMKRLGHVSRGRADDNPEIVEARKRIQDEDREPVLNYFKNKGILFEIDGKGSIEGTEQKIEKLIND